MSFPIDGGTRILKNRGGIFFKKKNLPAGVPYKKRAILSYVIVLSSRIITMSKSNSSEAEASSWDSRATTMALWQAPK